MGFNQKDQVNLFFSNKPKDSKGKRKDPKDIMYFGDIKKGAGF